MKSHKLSTSLSFALVSLFTLLFFFIMPSLAGAEATKLGDLSNYRAITADVASFIDKGDFASAKSRIKDLETLWDNNEAIIKPKAAADWHVLDKAIDSALHYVRAGKPDAAKCTASITALIASFDQMSGKL